MLQIPRDHLDLNLAPVLLAIPPPAANLTAKAWLRAIRQKSFHRFGWQKVTGIQGHEFLLLITVLAKCGPVHREKLKSPEVINPHGLGVINKQIPVLAF